MRQPRMVKTATGASGRPSTGGVLKCALFAALLAASSIAGCVRSGAEARTTLRFWAMGREGEVVPELVRDFERMNPGIRVIVQQIPWSAAHEKLLTSFVGRCSPDLAQLGNTWIAEFVALHALSPLSPRLATSSELTTGAFFPGIWDTNVIEGVPYGIPWYVDTRVIFYRKDLLSRAGYTEMPKSWKEWREAMRAIKQVVGPDKYGIFLPINEWNPPVILGLQAGSPLLKDNATRGAFSDAAFRGAFAFFLDLFREGLAPPVANTEVANLYQEFARGYFSMYISGPWNLGEFQHRLPPELQGSWGTAPFPGPDGAASGVSLAGGASLVLFRRSKNQEAAWKLIEFLSRPEVQARFYRLTGDLPARREAWQDSTLQRDANTTAFGKQLERVVSTPKIPEWESIAAQIQYRTEAAVRGGVAPDSALAALDRDVDRILEKRRWLLARQRGQGISGPKETP